MAMLELKMAQRDESISHFTDFVFFPPVLSSELVLFCTEPKLMLLFRE